MKAFTTLAFSLVLSTFAFSQLNISLVSSVDYGTSPGGVPWDMNDVWGYVAPDDTEYALVGLPSGVSILNLSDPANPVESDFIPGIISPWRDIKTWEQYAYVSNESGNGLTIIDLSNLPGEVTSHDWSPNIPDLGGTLQSIHNIWIDEHGFLYISGANINGGAVIFADLSEPNNPVHVGQVSLTYSHDVYVRDNIMYSSDIDAGILSITDVSDKSNPILLATQTTPGNFTHQAWLSDDSNYVFTNDEINNGAIAAYDIRDLNDIQEVDIYRPYETLGDGVIPHNILVWEDWLVISYYTDGVIIVDASRPENLVEVGNFDTFIPESVGFNGIWGVYPYLPSGLILASDMSGQLFVFEPNYVRACYLEGKVTDAITGNVVQNATITIEDTPVIEASSLIGNYKTGLATAGTYTVQVNKAGYDTFSGEAVLENGQITILDIALQPSQRIAINGQVIDEETNEIIGNAVVRLINDNFMYETTTTASGDFSVEDLVPDTYTIFAGKWGYETIEVTDVAFDATNTSTTIKLETGILDIFELDLGWTIEGDATSGAWERVNTPMGHTFGSEFLSPNNDSSFDRGNGCFVTGNGNNNSVSGTTRIISPSFGFLSDEGNPRLAAVTWMLSVPDITFPLPDEGPEKLYIIVDNGIEQVVIDSISSAPNLPAWSFNSAWRLKDYIELTGNMRVIFEVSSLNGNFVEAGIDRFRVWDGDLTDTEEANAIEPQMAVFPNPTSTSFNVQYDLEKIQPFSKLVVYNILGQAIEERNLSDKNATVELGQDWNKGIYLVQIQNGTQRSRTIRLVKN